MFWLMGGKALVLAVSGLLGLGFMRYQLTHTAAEPRTLPYRFLLVVGDEWKDETSTLVDRPADFQVVAALLKSWGLPFDLLRLDQQPFDAYHLLDRDGTPRYGTIVWMAGPDFVRNRNFAFLARLVRELGTNLVALGDTVETALIAELAGVVHVSDYKLPDGLAFTREHFITRGLGGREHEFVANMSYAMGGVRVTAPAGIVAATRGTAPFLTARSDAGRGRLVWLGAERSVAQLEKQIVRDLLKRALVWAQGYALYAEYERSVILFIDDFGTSDKTALPYWHYKTPTEDEIRTGMIEPLRRRGAVMDVNVVTGYADRKTQRILVPWQQRVVDEIDPGVIHDFASTRRGIEAGVAAGVFQIECDGWTHMLPDLDSPPGPWWTAPMDGTGHPHAPLPRLTRLSPVFPFALLNYAFGLTRVKLSDYVLASWIGIMPGTVMYVYLGSLARVGATGGKKSPAELALYGVGLLATLAVTVLTTRLARRALAKRAHAQT